MTYTGKLTLGLALLLATLGAVSAQEAKGYVGPGSEKSGTITVSEVLSAKDGKDVVLRGHLVQQVDRDHYVFEDATGRVPVKLKHRMWKNGRADAKTPVEISGEVEVHHKLVSVEVDELRILGQ
ncbi:NirD/YgiW/YdeI family stress tolerance protein [Frateuria defendens]|uniref:NirD/YgiW/YdeI family stress tolerance protein n=1 Tax=Frateuria defendens TaxID=2219559 RepID=UPI0007DC32FA|nr:NirD/YgiW/YdeI family stress tolerance protein [Frateuria defendens]